VADGGFDNNRLGSIVFWANVDVPEVILDDILPKTYRGEAKQIIGPVRNACQTPKVIKRKKESSGAETPYNTKHDL